MGDLHDRVVGVLAEHCRSSKRKTGKLLYENVYAEHIEGYEKKPLTVTLVRRKGSLIENYYPDIWAEYPRGGVEIFEVWHTETESEAIIDIIFSALVKDVKFLDIVCTGYGIEKDRAKDLVDLLLGKLHDRKGEHLLPPDKVYIASLPEEVHQNREKIKKLLIYQLKI